MRRNLNAPIGAGCLAAMVAPAAGQTQVWQRQFGVNAADWALALASDSAGGAYIAGHTEGGLGGPHAGSRDAWLSRYDGSGIRLWIRQLGTNATEQATAVAPSAGGGVFMAGWTESGVWPIVGGGDAWLTRYDASGNASWFRFLGLSGYDVARALAPDGSDGVYVAGAVLVGNPGGQLAVLARYDAQGNQLWVRQFGPTGNEFARALAADGMGGVFIAGNSGTMDAWLARYDDAGNQEWFRLLESADAAAAKSLAPDGAGGVFMAGDAWGELAAPSVGGWDAWLARYDAAGTLGWIHQFGSGADDVAESLAADGTGGVIVAGYTDGVMSGASAGNYDAWFARYNAAGAQAWMSQFGTSSFDVCFAAAPDGLNSWFIGGMTAGSLAGPSAGQVDAWLARYTDACYPDCNGDGSLTVADFGCFQTKFVAADPYADCNGDGQRTVADFGCFQTKFVAGCP